MRRFLIAGLALALAACGNAGGTIVSTGATAAATAADAVGMKPPAVLEATTLDEKAIKLTAGGVDVAALASSALVKTGIVTRGSPTAQRMARALDDARRWVNAAAAARLAGSAQSYREALDKAEGALAAVRDALNPFGG